MLYQVMRFEQFQLFLTLFLSAERLERHRALMSLSAFAPTGGGCCGLGGGLSTA
jgi:hypothetical protein